MHVFPNYITLPQDARAYERVSRLLRARFGLGPDATIQQLEAAGARGATIGPDEAIALVAPIRTGSRNTWRDSTISPVIKKVAEKFQNRLTLRFRTADRTVRENGFISTGTLSGDELRAARAAALPTLWIMSARTTDRSAAAGGLEFMYPTLVIPDSFPSLFMFNRGQ